MFLDPWAENHSAETAVFPSDDGSLHPREPDSTTTNNLLLLYNIQSQKLQVSLLSHVHLKHKERIIVHTTVSFVCDACFCIFLNTASCN